MYAYLMRTSSKNMEFYKIMFIQPFDNGIFRHGIPPVRNYSHKFTIARAAAYGRIDSSFALFQMPVHYRRIYLCHRSVRYLSG